VSNCETDVGSAEQRRWGSFAGADNVDGSDWRADTGTVTRIAAVTRIAGGIETQGGTRTRHVAAHDW
jgi:hypothetical protein